MKTPILLSILIALPLHINAYSFKDAKQTLDNHSLKMSGVGFLVGSFIYYIANNRLEFLYDREEEADKLADYLQEVSRLEKTKNFGMVLGFSSLAVLTYLLWQKHYKKPASVLLKPTENLATQQEKILEL